MAEIYLIDGHALIYRSFYAIPKLTTSTGQFTNAVYGFTNTILKLIKGKKTEYLAVAFDVKGPTFRHQVFKEYKIHRKPMPDELSAQLPTIRKVLDLLGIKTLEKEGYEADDVIASFAKNISKQGHNVFILTGDKDIFQILSDSIIIINPGNNEIRDVRWFNEKFGLSPEKTVDILALAGDQSDNVPGVPGIGEKTAIKLLQQFNSVEELYSKIDEISSEKLKKKLLEGKELAFFSKQLVILEENLPFGLSIEETKIKQLKIEELTQLLEKLEFKKLITQIYTIFGLKNTIQKVEDNIGFSTDKIYSFEEIKNNPFQFKKILEDPEIEKYGYNLKKKITNLAQEKILLQNISFDIAIAKYLTGKIHNEQNIFESMEKYKEDFKKNNQEYLFYKVEMPLVEVLAWMEINGIKIDVPYLEKLSNTFSSELEILQNQVYKLSGEVFNINSTQQLSNILFEKLGLPAKKKIKTGYSTDNSVLTELSKIHPMPKLLLEYRELFKLKSTYTESLIPYVKKETGRIHPSFNQMVTVTGRLSCSNPNLQNIPIKTEKGSLIRKSFCASEKNIFYSFDYSQIELRILAHFSEDPQLLNAFLKDKDIHQETAEILFFTPTSLFSQPVEVGENINLRRIAKTINFGVIYGMSPFGLSKELNVPINEADRFIHDYFEKFKGVKNYIEKTVEYAEKQGYVTTIFGRVRHIPEIHSSDKNQREFGRRAAINMPIQGSAADLIKLAMVRIFEKFKKESFKSKLVLQIHDELLFDVVPEEETKIQTYIKEIMEKAMNLKVPMKVDVKRGKNYLEMEKI